ncbi:transporter substrate-binding domain-containing protein [Rheinheimera metallidurans]|uniref:transporter substrate-binding domain-containing protein n=1 Tax=Rheinheimera metallidurans TaxID=2925781 RepID=UPI003002DD93
MSSKLFPLFFFFILILFTTSAPSYSQDKTSATENKVLRIGVKEAPPFVMYDGETYSGLSIDLWQEIADEHGWQFKYQPHGLTDLLNAATNGTIDVGLGAITATAERAAKMDFTHTVSSSGLSVAVRSEWSSGWMAVLSALASEAFLKIITLLIIVLLIVGFIVWLLEHKRNQEQFGGSTAQGLFSGFWWAMVTMTTVGYGDIAPKTVGGRLLGLVWMLTALIIVSFFTASITSALTVGQLSNRLSHADGLKGMHIASLSGSTSSLWLDSRKLSYNKATDLTQALEQLKDGKVDAVIYDEPLLRWTINQQFSGKLQVLPLTLARQDYVFVLPNNSPLREKINASLLNRINAPNWPQRVASYFDGEQ